MNMPVERVSISESEALELFGGRRFNSYSSYFRRVLGARTQKVAINAGFSCPNRDGKVGVGGCTFCNNSAFTPSYCEPSLSVTTQINEGVSFHLNRYRSATKYLAYFQSFSNTYAPLEQLRALYDEALAHPLIAGVIIGTRPDCVDLEKLDYFAELAQSHYVAIEYGVESCYDETLRAINRGHDFATAEWAIRETAARGIHTGAHFILGLPGESEEMLMAQMARINALPLTTIKFHQLQIFKDTLMAREYDLEPDKFRFWERDAYIAFFIKMLELMRPDLVLERFASEAPPRFHYGPNWGTLRNESILNIFEKELAKRGTYQGRRLISSAASTPPAGGSC